MTLTLFWGSASPFVRKVMAVAHDLGIADDIDIRNTAAHPVDRDLSIQQANPLAKVPAAQTADGTVLYDSRVICEYLDTLHDGGLFPAPGPARWTALRRQALADGLMDAAILIRYETLIRPEDYRWPLWIEKQHEKLRDALAAMADDLPDPGCADIGAITYASALGWISFRFPDLDWPGIHPALAAWHADFETRPAMIATRPTA